MFPVPCLVFDVIALLLDEVRDHDALSCGEEDDGEGGRVFDRVEEWPFTFVGGSGPLDHTLTEAYEIGQAVGARDQPWSDIRHPREAWILPYYVSSA